ncbi:hypothetical protein B0H14DRAFT_2557209 [Mycena olivaceomarginata]|nr:hypothetical protein B0H14DRAFT_2557209 [Mycena olivaceomarginata]
MLHQICRRGRLLASISDSLQTTDSQSPVVKAMQVLAGKDPVSAHSKGLQQLSPAEETAYNGSGVVLEVSMYAQMLSYWNRRYSPPYLHQSELTYDLLDAGINVFPTRAVPRTIFTHKTRDFSTFKKHRGNSCVSFRHPETGRKDIGYIQAIWTQALQGQCRTFVVLQLQTWASPTDAAKTPYPTHPFFECSVAYSEPLFPQPQLIVEPCHIISHVSYYKRPKGMYGIERAILWIRCIGIGIDGNPRRQQ